MVTMVYSDIRRRSLSPCQSGGSSNSTAINTTSDEGGRSRIRRRGPCTYCKARRKRCYFPYPGARSCSYCSKNGFACQILPQVSRRVRGRRRFISVTEDEDLGASNRSLFSPGGKPDILADGEKLSLPPILAKKIVSSKEVKELFEMYFECMNLSACILDPSLHTPERTLHRSSFLFTVVCAVASRYHPSRETLYPTLMNYAQLAAGTTIISGRTSLEACQAYILLSLYPIPAHRWSEDRSWMYLGCAIRMATDLNLHHPPMLEGGEGATTINTNMDVEWQSREFLNRSRCWLGCFNSDKAMSTQFGKPTMLREDWVIPILQRNKLKESTEGWCSSPYGWKLDIHLCAYSALLREISSFHEKIYSDPTNPIGLNKDINFEELTYEFDNRIDEVAKEWFHLVDTYSIKDDPECIFKKGLLQLEFHYNQLVALSFGFQHAFGRGVIQKGNRFLQRCYVSATRVARIVVDKLGSQKYIRYCPESYYIFAAFASAFLLKVFSLALDQYSVPDRAAQLLRPKFSTLLEVQQHRKILDLVRALGFTLNRIAMDDRHAPKLYSRFLLGLVKDSEKILERGSNPSSPSASSPASITHGNTGSRPAYGFPTSSSDTTFILDVNSPTDASDTFIQYIPNQEAQTQFSYDVPDVMDGVRNSPPQGSRPHATRTEPDDGDTFMCMQLLGDQFWEDGLLPGFSWSGSTGVHHGDSTISNYSRQERLLPMSLIPE